MIRTASLILFGVFVLGSCKKETQQNISCNACRLIGTYSGTFHHVAGCYACIPYLDSIFVGSFAIDTLPNDSIVIKRSYDNYEWRFAYSDTGNYSRWGCCTVGETFMFKEKDSLTYYYNNGGSGGYFREEFLGKK